MMKKIENLSTLNVSIIIENHSIIEMAKKWKLFILFWTKLTIEALLCDSKVKTDYELILHLFWQKLNNFFLSKYSLSIK